MIFFRTSSLASFRYLYSTQMKLAQAPLINMPSYYLIGSQNGEGSKNKSPSQPSSQPLLSFWKDIKPEIDFSNGTMTVVVEIPQISAAKTQLIKQIPFHPIMQDTRINKHTQLKQLRHFGTFLPLMNYGFVPQTWQQNIRKDQNGLYGDDDPIDICELDYGKQRRIGDVVKVKVLGGFCLIDQGQLDWKVLTIDQEIARQRQINSFEDVERSRVTDIMKWFKVYKTFDGKPENTIGYDQKILSKQEILKVIQKTNKQYRLLAAQSQDPEYIKRRKLYHLI